MNSINIFISLGLKLFRRKLLCVNNSFLTSIKRFPPEICRSSSTCAREYVPRCSFALDREEERFAVKLEDDLIK